MRASAAKKLRNISNYYDAAIQHSKSSINPNNKITPIYDFKTKNQSFIDVHTQLAFLGIKNNKFHLLLLNPLLQGVDPYDPNVTMQQVMMIIQECKLNIFYYLREVVRIDESGSGTPIPFRMDRGTLAALYCFYNNINFYLMKPRQTGKTVGITAMLSWAFKFSGPNGDFLFSCYKDTLAKKNLRGMKTMLKNLPSYLSNAGTTTTDNSGKVVRKTDNITRYVEPGQNNSAMVANCAATEDAADTVGRGYTQIYQYYDEAEFTKFIGTLVDVSGMAFNTASRNAAKNGSGYCRIFSTTPGDLGNKKACQSAMDIVNDAIVWNETWYDKEVSEFKALIKEKSNYRVVYIEYDYKQLGYDEEWFVDACSQVGNKPARIRREILLERYSGNSNSPFTPEEIEDLNENMEKPKWVKHLSSIYDLLFYEKPIPGRKYFMGLDPSDGTGGDNYAMTIIDPYTLKIVAEFKSPYMTIHGCVDVVEYIVKHYFPDILIVVERNRNGGAVIEMLKENPLLRNKIYASPEANGDNSRIRDKLDDNGFIKEEFIRNKYFGTNTTSSTRTVMMNILLDTVHFAREYVNSKYVVEDIKNLIIKSEKIQAAPGEHDDSVMSWLIVMYVYYYGEHLERYGFRKGELPNDIQNNDKFIQAKKMYRNPEIKKNFPTLFAYYEYQSELDKAVEAYNYKTPDETTTLHRIGSLDALNENNKMDDIPDIDNIGIENGVFDPSNLVRRFMKLNN